MKTEKLQFSVVIRGSNDWKYMREPEYSYTDK